MVDFSGDGINYLLKILFKNSGTDIRKKANMINAPLEYKKMGDAETSHWWYRTLHKKVAKTIAHHYRDKTINILDAGCGTGGLLRYLSNKGYKNASGFDVSSHAIAIARSKNVVAELLDIRSACTRYNKSSFDVIIANDILYFPSRTELRSLLECFYSLLGKTGIVIVNVPALGVFAGEHDKVTWRKKMFTKTELVKLVESTPFRLASLGHWPFILSPVILAFRSFQRFQKQLGITPKRQSDIKMHSKTVNTSLKFLCDLEAYSGLCFPFGSSIFSVLTKES